MDQINAVSQRTWVAACSHRLQQQWPTVSPQHIEAVADELWHDERLRSLEPSDAAAEWLRPILRD